MAHYAESMKLPLDFEKELKWVKEREERCRQMEQEAVNGFVNSAK